MEKASWCTALVGATGDFGICSFWTACGLESGSSCWHC